MPILKTSILEVPQDEVAARLAVLQVTGVGTNKCVQLLSEEFNFNFTRTQLKRLELRDTFVRTIEEYKKNIVKKAVSDLKEQASRLIPKIVSSIENGLDNNHYQVIPHALKILGVENVEPDNNKQAQVLQVVLPGHRPQEKVVNETED